MSRATERFPWEAVMDRLAAFYHAGDWRVPYLRDHAEDPFQVLIGTILSQRTRDEATDRASAALFAQYPDARSLAAAPIAEIERLIRPVGFYRAKARNLADCAQLLVDETGGPVPPDLEALLSLPGVGRKTANCVLVFGFAEPAIPVDTHVHRISNRLGVVRTRTPEETERRLEEVVPRDYWIPLNPLLVQHGQNLCGPGRPKCDRCPIVEWCATGQRFVRDRGAGRRRTERPKANARPRRPARRR